MMKYTKKWQVIPYNEESEEELLKNKTLKNEINLQNILKNNELGDNEKFKLFESQFKSYLTKNDKLNSDADEENKKYDDLDKKIDIYKSSNDKQLENLSKVVKNIPLQNFPDAFKIPDLPNNNANTSFHMPVAQQTRHKKRQRLIEKEDKLKTPKNRKNISTRSYGLPQVKSRVKSLTKKILDQVPEEVNKDISMIDSTEYNNLNWESTDKDFESPIKSNNLTIYRSPAELMYS